EEAEGIVGRAGEVGGQQLGPAAVAAGDARGVHAEGVEAARDRRHAPAHGGRARRERQAEDRGAGGRRGRGRGRGRQREQDREERGFPHRITTILDFTSILAAVTWST